MSSFSDLAPGTESEVRECAKWLREINQQLVWLTTDILNQLDAVTIQSKSLNLTLEATEERANGLVRLLADDRYFNCLAHDVAMRVVAPQRELLNACTYIGGEASLWRDGCPPMEEGWGETLDLFIHAQEWWRREAKSLRKLLAVVLEAARRDAAQLMAMKEQPTTQIPKRQRSSRVVNRNRKIAQMIVDGRSHDDVVERFGASDVSVENARKIKSRLKAEIALRIGDGATIDELRKEFGCRDDQTLEQILNGFGLPEDVTNVTKRDT